MSRLEIILVFTMVLIVGAVGGNYIWKQHAEKQRLEAIRITEKLRDATIRTNKVIDECNNILKGLKGMPGKLEEYNKTLGTRNIGQAGNNIKQIGNEFNALYRESNRVCVPGVMANKPVADKALMLIKIGRLEEAERLVDSMVVNMPDGF